jgi:hypothetical protein
MDANSSIQVASLSPTLLEISLINGAMSVNMESRAGDTTTVSSGNFALTVRGTLFVVYADDNNEEFIVYMLSGSGEVGKQPLAGQPFVATYALSAGQMMTATTDDTPSAFALDATLPPFVQETLLVYQAYLIESGVYTEDDFSRIDPRANSDAPDDIDETQVRPTNMGIVANHSGITVVSFTFQDENENIDLTWDDISDFELTKNGVRRTIERAEINNIERHDLSGITIFHLHFTQPINEPGTYVFYAKYKGIQFETEPHVIM